MCPLSQWMPPASPEACAAELAEALSCWGYPGRPCTQPGTLCGCPLLLVSLPVLEAPPSPSLGIVQTALVKSSDFRIVLVPIFKTVVMVDFLCVWFVENGRISKQDWLCQRLWHCGGRRVTRLAMETGRPLRFPAQKASHGFRY